MLVVASVGTDHHPFDRLLEWCVASSERLGARFVVQTGATSPRSGVECVDFMAPDELEELMRSADAVICHGGPGTIAAARSAGHRPIVAPRRPQLGEHVDDHQMRFAESMAAAGDVDVVDSLEALIALLERPRVRIDLSAESGQAAAVAEFGRLVDQLVSGELATRPWRHRFLVRRVPRRP